MGKLAGGVLHAKDFIVDDRIVFVGSQNWGWRALTRIHEIGAVARNTRLAQTFAAVLDLHHRRQLVAARADTGVSAVAGLMPDIEVKYSAPRKTPQGFIPYARLEHCKPARRRRKRYRLFRARTGT
ncbi:phospholipase D/transphosphatidylase, partial [mine drainage metagenome]